MKHEPGRWLSPAEAARKLGVTVKALRIYEQHGLVTPLRSQADWRAYGPEQIARLHQVLALKRLGLSLARIGALLAGKAATLSDVLTLQEQALSAERNRVEHALTLIRAARLKIDRGEALSIDDLTQLTKETTMTAKPTPEEMKAIFEPHALKHFSQSEIADTANRKFDPAYTQQAWDDLTTEAKALMAKNAAVDAPETLEVARRWRGMIRMFTGGNPDIEKRVGQVWQSAFADPGAAPKLPMGPEVFMFMGQAMNKLKERGE